MAETRLTGSRIRERRMLAGMRQSELAQRVEISASYLNLIEHNRRRIAGSLLTRIAGALGVEPALLSEGAEATRIDALRAAAARVEDNAPEVELDRIEEFVGRFPGWAALVAGQEERVDGLEARVRALTDRLEHDPELARSLHEVISAVTSIRSTSSILTGDPDLDADWREHFLRNIREDARRLADNSRSLAAYLEKPVEDGPAGALSPLEAADAFLEAAGHHFPALEETPGPEGIARVLDDATGLAPAARVLVEERLQRLGEDILALPGQAFAAAARDCGYRPAELARRFGVPLDRVLRRIASLPPAEGHPPTGLAICDGAGVLTTVKPLNEVALPRSGAACPYWPLFESLGTPGRPVGTRVALAGRSGRGYRCYAIAAPRGAVDFDAAPLLEATMLVMPAEEAADAPMREAGIACRICPREGCPARREPSMLARSG